MADTPFYHFALPAIGADQDSWGNKLNGNWSALDTLLHSISVGTGTFLPLTGGTITGNLSVNGSTSLKGTTVVGALTTTTLGVSSTATIGNLNVSGASTFTGGIAVSGTASFANNTAFAIYSNGAQRVYQPATNCNFAFNTADSQWFWNTVTTKMRLDGSGNLYVTGTGFQPAGGPWGASSDERVKRNIVPYAAGLDAVCRIRPISFEYNGLGDTLDDGTIYYGVSAQHTRTVMPELVHEMPTPARQGSYLPGQLGTQLGPLTLALVNAVRELRDRVLALEAERAA